MSIVDVDATTYHADRVTDQPTLSRSVAHILLTQSPAHAWFAHPRLNPAYEAQEEERFDIGTACHALLLEGSAAVEVIDAADWRTKDARAARDTARFDGKIPLLARHWQAVQDMTEAVVDQLERHEADPTPFTGGQAEKTLAWTDQDVRCRARLDWLHNDHLTVDDFKTTAVANPDAWTRSIYGYGYDLQAAFYLRGVKATTGKDAQFRFVVVEKSPPYALSVVSLAPSALALAYEKVDRALTIWKRCLDTGEWPGYPARVAYAELPAWEEMRWLEKDTREAA